MSEKLFSNLNHLFDKKREKIKLYRTEIFTKHKIDSASTPNSRIVLLDSLKQIPVTQKIFPQQRTKLPLFS